MATTIQIKRGTGSAVPTGLADGELAINLDSGKLFFGSGSNSINSFRFENLTAENYIVSSSVTNIITQTLSGSTAFGDSADDTHQFIGNITASGNISASGTIHGSDLTLEKPLEDSTFLTLMNSNTSGDVQNQKSFVEFSFVDSNANNYPQVKIGAHVGNNDGNASTQTEEGQGAFVVYTNDSPNTTAGEDNTEERLRVDFAGNVGIGDATPTAKLDVAGNINSTSHITASGNISASGDIKANTFTAAGNVDFDGDLDVDGTTNLDIVDIDGAVDMASTLTVDGTLDIAGELQHSGDTDTKIAFTDNAVQINAGGTAVFRSSVTGSVLLNTHQNIFDTGSLALSGDGGAIGDIVKFGGSTTVAGGIYALTGSDWSVASATSTATGATSSLAVALGTDPASDGMCLRGFVHPSNDPGAPLGNPLFLNATAGRFSSAAPSSTNNVVRILGYQYGTDLIYFNPSNDFIVHS